MGVYQTLKPEIMKLKILLTGLVLITCFKGYSQQNFLLTRYVFNGLAVNPAYAGYREVWWANMSYRTQWTGMEGAPRSATLSIDGLTNNTDKKVGLGLVAVSDRIGPQRMTSVFANYAYRLRLDEADTKRLSFGLGAGLTQYMLDAGMFNAADQDDALLPVTDDNNLKPNARFGVYYSSTSFYAGASVTDVLSSLTSRSGNNALRQIPHMYLTAGAMIPISPMFDLKPSILIKEDFKAPSNADFTLFLAMEKKIWLGAAYRTGIDIQNRSTDDRLKQKGMISGIIEVFFDRFRLGYAFDYTNSNIRNYEKGTHEISLGLSFSGKKDRIISPRYF